jgi:HlyD family secretion protein
MNMIKKIWTSVWGFIKKFKKTVIVAIIIIVGGFWYYHSTHIATATTYTVKPASIGTVQTTVSGTGQVSSSQELAIDPQVSGTVVTVNVKDGDTVTKGEVLATLDSTDAYYSLENAQIAVQKLETSDPISLTGDQNTLTNSQTSESEAYQSAFNSISSAYNDMSTVVTGLNNLFYGKDASPYFSDTNVGVYGTTALGYKQTAGLSVDQVTAEYNSFQQTYLATTVSSSTSVDNALAQEVTIAQDLATAVKNTSLAVNYVISQIPVTNHTSTMTTDQSNISSWLSTADQDTSNLASAQTSLQSAEQTVTQAQANLNADQGTNDPLALQSAELSLQEAQTTYDDYTITAPFDGVIGNVTLQPGDSAGPSTAIGTIVTKQYQSTIVLNEINVAKVAVGQPVDVTFNALPGITATGTVTDVDVVGTVSSGVVSYNVVISYNSDNAEIKAGMSINANIITAEEDNVLVVPNSAVKTLANGESYVQIPAGPVASSSVTVAGGGRTRGAGGFGSSTRAYGGGYGSTTASSTFAGYGYASSTTASGTPAFGGGFGSSTRTRTAGTGTAAVAAGGTVTSVTDQIVQVGLSDNTNTQILSGLTPGELVVTETNTGTAAVAAKASTSILSSLGGAGGTTRAAGGYTGGGGGGFTGGGRGG